MTIIQSGTVLAVWIGPFRHIGIATDRFVGGEQCVISNSRRRGLATEEPLSVFAADRKIYRVEWPFSISVEEVLQRARSMLGRRWSIFDNCEHFVRRAFAQNPGSGQLLAFGFIAIVVVGVVASKK